MLVKFYCYSKTFHNVQSLSGTLMWQIYLIFFLILFTFTLGKHFFNVFRFVKLFYLAAVKAIDDAGCDSITKRRVREVHEIPGALWHIYDAHDADKIRDFLNKVPM